MIRILIADNQPVFREGLKCILKQQNNMQVVCEADNGVSVLNLISEYKPDVIMVELRLPGINGIETAQQIRDAHKNIPVIALCSVFSSLSVRNSIKAGITGFVEKISPKEEIVSAIESVIKGQNYYCRSVRILLATSLQEMLQEVIPHKERQLSVAERELVEMLTNGKSVNEIAFNLNQSPKTIDARRRTLMRRLGFSNLADLTKYALIEGIISLA